jgi:hypothetical protein
MLWPDPAQKPRLTEIRDNLVARIPGEAEREGWLGEVDGLRISFTAAEHKLAQLDATTTRHHRRRARHPYAHDKPLTDANPWQRQPRLSSKNFRWTDHQGSPGDPGRAAVELR